MSQEHYYITTPIYYVNARPHLGHTYTTIACDTMARYQRLRKRKVFFLTGTDEHGDKIAEAAEKEGKTAAEYATEISQAFQNAWATLNITHDRFIRTTDSDHKKTVQSVLQKIYDNGDIYLDQYEGKYCTGCERYLTDKELTEDGLCPDHQRPPKIIKEENYFFRMQKYFDRWLQMIHDKPDLIRPARYRNEVISTIEALKEIGEDLSISRPKTRLEWGIELPFDTKYVTYVWFDALLNYITGIGYNQSESFDQYWAHSHHMIAKDILKPHGIYWPTMLLAAGLPVYDSLLVHGYWLGWGDLKMSKSLGNAADPESLSANVGEDALRYFLMREMNFGSDSKFTEELVYRRINNDLANDLGNMTQRTLSMIKKYYQGKIDPVVEPHDLEKQVNDILIETSERYHSSFENFEFHKALEAAFEIIRPLNQMVEEYQPWKKAKENAPDLQSFLQSILKGILAGALYLKPVLVNKVDYLFSIVQAEYETAFVTSLDQIKLKDHTLDQWDILFPRYEPDKT